MGSEQDTWDVARYERFRAQRERPALDLLDLLAPAPGGRAADLGCGTGRHTVALHRHVGAGETLGVDTSPRMLEESRAWRVPGVRFELADLTDVGGGWDVLYANASLQWVADHRALLPHLASKLRPGGQLAFQVPANFDHPSHTVADEVGRGFGLDPLDRAIDVLGPADYAELLHGCGFGELDVTLRIYGHEMERTDEVVDWVSGTLLTRFERQLPPERFEEFLAEYRKTLLAELGDPSGAQPYFYAFPRILCRARRRA